jgi:GNAT superfamily N-acetyltransferase
MIKFQRSRYDDPVFITLTSQLDADLSSRYFTQQEDFAAQNKMDASAKVIVAYEDDEPIGCGALRPMDERNTVELKRMYVLPEYRGRGISGQLLLELEKWAAEDGFRVIRLETGNKQPEAIALYLKRGYLPIAPYGPYVDEETSLCMEKQLRAGW